MTRSHPGSLDSVVPDHKIGSSPYPGEGVPYEYAGDGLSGIQIFRQDSGGAATEKQAPLGSSESSRVSMLPKAAMPSHCQLLLERIPYFALRNLCKTGGREALSSCQVSTLHRTRRVTERTQRTMAYQSSIKSGRRESSNVQKSRLRVCAARTFRIS